MRSGDRKIIRITTFCIPVGQRDYLKVCGNPVADGGIARERRRRGVLSNTAFLER